MTAAPNPTELLKQRIREDGRLWRMAFEEGRRQASADVARVRRETAEQIAQALDTEVTQDERDPDRQTDYWVGVNVGKRSAAAVARGFAENGGNE